MLHRLSFIFLILTDGGVVTGVVACGDGLLGISNGVATGYPDMMFNF